MKLEIVCIAVIIGLCSAHDIYRGSCPVFTPKSDFNWGKFRAGRWYAAEKFDTKSSCLTYDFKEDEDGDYLVEQTSVLTAARRVSVDNKVKYRGRLAAPDVNEPANMEVKFTLNPFGKASFVVLDTDYDNYALVCTCQDKKFLFSVFTFHRRSCTILQRTPPKAERDKASEDISKQLHDLLNKQIKPDDGEKADHDFDIVMHSDCEYEDNGKGLQLDVEKILGAGTDEVGSTVKDIVKDIDELFSNADKERNEISDKLIEKLKE